MNIHTDNPGCIPVPLASGESKTVFDGTRTTNIDGTTAFNLALSTVSSTTYRLTNSAGTAPAFRTNRNAAAGTRQLTWAVLANLTVTVTSATGTPFSSVVAGDQVFVPGASTGDAASPFNALNEGLWFVLTATSTVLTLTRAAGTVFSGASEVVTPPTNASLLAYSATGVQAGDTLSIAAGFATTSRHAYDITSVTPSWLEFTSTTPLGAESGIVPGVTGVQIYTNSKRFIMIEADQQVVVQLNGDTGSSVQVEPWLAGDDTLQGVFIKVGDVWKLVVQNVSNTNANVTVSSAE